MGSATGRPSVNVESRGPAGQVAAKHTHTKTALSCHPGVASIYKSQVLDLISIYPSYSGKYRYSSFLLHCPAAVMSKKLKGRPRGGSGLSLALAEPEAPARYCM